MRKKYENAERTREVLKNALWLAWNASGGPMGMGVFQDNPSASREDVWERVHNAGEYAMATAFDGSLVADYVFGRAIKLCLHYGEDYIEVPEHEPRSGYQAWCTEFPSYEALISAAEDLIEE